MNAPLSKPPLDWVIIGGGPIGVHIAVRLLAAEAIEASRIRIIDPGPELLHRWNTCTTRTGMRYLRSPAVHHIGENPFDLLQFAGRKKRHRRGRGLFTNPYQRPATSFFAAHCQSVIEQYGLAEVHIRDRVHRIDITSESVHLHSNENTLSTARVVLALGNKDEPAWPDLAKTLRDDGGTVFHLFSEAISIDVDALPQRVAILGGGISAAQFAVRLADAGKNVSILSRHEIREHQFDSDPGWIGPKYMQGFWNTKDYGRRRELVRFARHKGSMPSDVVKSLDRAMSGGTVTWRVGSLSEGSVTTQETLLLKLDTEEEKLEVDALVLATGFSTERPGGALIDQLITDHDLPISECGYPIVDSNLSWHPRIFVTGALAELELGPMSRNITGGRRAGERILEAAQSQKRTRKISEGIPHVAVIASMLLSITQGGCSSAGNSDSGDAAGSEPLPPMGNLLIEEVYYAGAVPTAGIDRYYSDQFIELVNIADAPVMVGGLILGDAPGSSGAINPGNEPGGPYIADPDTVFLTTAWRIPGEPEDVLLQPGASLVIAQDASTHNPYSPIDLSEADYETYVEEYGEDLESAIVPNLESIWYGSGYDWLVTVFGPTILVLDIDAEDLVPAAGSLGPVQAPVSAVIDTMEALMDADSGDYKRLHESVDSGFVYVSGTYTGESVRRRRDDSGALVDTNDSGADFEVLAMPDPATGSND